MKDKLTVVWLHLISELEWYLKFALMTVGEACGIFDQEKGGFFDRNWKKNRFPCRENISKQFDPNYKQTACCYKATLAPEKGGDPLVGRIAGNSTLPVL